MDHSRSAEMFKRNRRFIPGGVVSINRKVALRQLRNLGCEADAVTNGLEVIEALQRSPYDVIYHTGMIGFVANPLELTKTLLGMMNLEESCCSTRRMWKAARCRDNSGSTLRPLQMWLRCSNPASGGASSVPSAMFRKRLRSPTKIEAPRSRCDESVDETGGGPDRWTETNLRQSPG